MDETWDDYFQPREVQLWAGAPMPGVHGVPKILLAVFGLQFLAMSKGAFCIGLWQAFTVTSIGNAIQHAYATGRHTGRKPDTVWFQIRDERDYDGDRTTTRISFANIADGESVYRLIRGIQMGTA